MVISIGEQTPEEAPKKRKLNAALTANLWQPGQSGNPKGRPKGKLSLTTALRQYLEDNPSRVIELIQSLYRMATKGSNVQAMQEIFNRLDGKIADIHQLDTKLPVTLVFQPVIQAKELPEATTIDGEFEELEAKG